MNNPFFKQLCTGGIATAILTVCLAPAHAGAERNDKDVMHAVGVLKGIYNDCTKEKATSMVIEAAEKDSAAYVMNVLGLLYAEGIGTVKDGEKAVFWLNKAGERGFPDAFHNLGTIFKLGKCGMRQDFPTACRIFQKGADAGSPTCMYDMGFMRYKGLGCHQSYPDAMCLFEAAADSGNVYALYMLGLCYRNGYGTQQDEEKGMELLEKAAMLGYSAALEEVRRSSPENCLTDIYATDNTGTSQMPRIHTDVNDTTLLRGHYRGSVVTYDWSGQFVVGEKPAVMEVERNGDNILGYIRLGGDSIPFKAEMTAEGALKFKKSYAHLPERYATCGKVRYRLDCADLDIWSDRICGTLALYSLPQREPERPMYMELYRYDSKSATDTYGHISVTPCPFESQFDAIFELPEKASATVRIFNKAGLPVWKQELGTLETGKHRIRLSPTLTDGGYYVLNIAAGKQVLRAIIVKKGGGQ